MSDASRRLGAQKKGEELSRSGSEGEIEFLVLPEEAGKRPGSKPDYAKGFADGGGGFVLQECHTSGVDEPFWLDGRFD